ncbi:MAG: EAL domain-containing protein [Hyphomonadaceae bacterium]
MSSKKAAGRGLERISLATTLPIVASGLAASLFSLIAIINIGFDLGNANAASAQRAETIAATIAPDTAWREIARLEHFLRTGAQNQAAVFDDEGNPLAGNQSILDENSVRKYPVIWHGEQVGTLYTTPQVPFTTAIPLWLIALLGAVSTLAAHTAASFYSTKIAAHLETLTDYVSSLRIGQTPGELKRVDFSEIARIRVAVGRSVRRSRREIQKLRKVAYSDMLTGLPNHARLLDVMTTALQRATYEAPSAFIYLDIDGYRRACEALGGIKGQQMLVMVAERLTEQINALHKRGNIAGSGHILASLQGEGFGLFLPFVTDRQEVSSLVRALSQSFTRPFTLNGRSITLSISGGIALAPEDGDMPDELIRHADMALQQVRTSNRGAFQFFTPRLDRQIQGRLRLESELISAVGKGEFVPVFQPKIDFQTGKIVGAEALARWKRASGKIISPGAFIPLAEEIGLIEKIGQQVLTSACQSAAVWMKAGFETSVAVNVSPLQFKQDDFTDIVIEALTKAGLPPRRLELEVTESMAVSDPEQVTEVMRPLRAMGVRLAIDDFGTGHSNLSMLTQLPFDVFKIDRQFVSTLQSDRQAPAIVEMILAMAETLGLETVAEGVETALQADFLRRRGCTLAQGFHYSPGVPQAEFLTLLRKWQNGFAGPEAAPAHRVAG